MATAKAHCTLMSSGCMLRLWATTKRATRSRLQCMLKQARRMLSHTTVQNSITKCLTQEWISFVEAQKWSLQSGQTEVSQAQSLWMKQDCSIHLFFTMKASKLMLTARKWRLLPLLTLLWHLSLRRVNILWSLSSLPVAFTSATQLQRSDF